MPDTEPGTERPGGATGEPAPAAAAASGQLRIVDALPPAPPSGGIRELTTGLVVTSGHDTGAAPKPEPGPAGRPATAPAAVIATPASAPAASALPDFAPEEQPRSRRDAVSLFDSESFFDQRPASGRPPRAAQPDRTRAPGRQGPALLGGFVSATPAPPRPGAHATGQVPTARTGGQRATSELAARRAAQGAAPSSRGLLTGSGVQAAPRTTAIPLTLTTAIPLAGPRPRTTQLRPGTLAPGRADGAIALTGQIQRPGQPTGPGGPMARHREPEGATQPIRPGTYPPY